MYRWVELALGVELGKFVLADFVTVTPKRSALDEDTEPLAPVDQILAFRVGNPDTSLIELAWDKYSYAPIASLKQV